MPSSRPSLLFMILVALDCSLWATRRRKGAIQRSSLNFTTLPKTPSIALMTSTPSTELTATPCKRSLSNCKRASAGMAHKSTTWTTTMPASRFSHTQGAMVRTQAVHFTCFPMAKI